MILRDTPGGRVQAFIADWFATWSEAVDAPAGERPAQWREAVARLEATHFVQGAPFGDIAIPLDAARHAPGREIITEQRGCRVLTRLSGSATTHYGYTLVDVDGDWRIAGIEASAEPFEPLVGSPAIVAVADRESLLSAARIDAEFEPLPDDLEPNGDRAFVRGAKVNDTTRVEVERLGVLRVASGVLAVCDLSSWRVQPLARSVPAGGYPVDVAVGVDSERGTRVAIAIRVQIGDERKVVRWHPATDVAGGEGGVGIDAGVLSIFDMGSYVRLTEFSKTRAHERIAERAGDTLGAVVRLVEDADHVHVEAGLGDGVYPCYWGVDADGQPACLQVDFIRV
jgi:hypothetical protein